MMKIVPNVVFVINGNLGHRKRWPMLHMMSGLSVTYAGTGHITSSARLSDTLLKAVNSDGLTFLPKRPKL